MKIQSVKLVYFSPTGTTKSVLHRISQGLNTEIIEHIDITKPCARNKELSTKDYELLIVGAPVYMGRVPAVINDWLHTINGSNTPTICVVVYGNRVYDNALLELGDILTNCGCVPIAGGAFIGEHSFHSSEFPAASVGRPDKSDVDLAKSFGNEIWKKLLSFTSVDDMPKLRLPGSFPYKGVTKMWDVDFIDINSDCIECGICSDRCPTGAIAPGDSSQIDIVKCTLCCACIKNCPQNARTMKPGPMKDAAQRVHELFRARKEPEMYL